MEMFYIIIVDDWEHFLHIFIGFIKKLSSELLFTVVSVFSNMAAIDLVRDQYHRSVKL